MRFTPVAQDVALHEVSRSEASRSPLLVTELAMRQGSVAQDVALHNVPCPEATQIFACKTEHKDSTPGDDSEPVAETSGANEVNITGLISKEGGMPEQFSRGVKAKSELGDGTLKGEKCVAAGSRETPGPLEY